MSPIGPCACDLRASLLDQPSAPVHRCLLQLRFAYSAVCKGKNKALNLGPPCSCSVLLKLCRHYFETGSQNKTCHINMIVHFFHWPDPQFLKEYGVRNLEPRPSVSYCKVSYHTSGLYLGIPGVRIVSFLEYLGTPKERTELPASV